MRSISIGLQCVQNNIETFGYSFAAKQLNKKKVPFAIAYWMIFGKAPNNPAVQYVAPNNIAARLVGNWMIVTGKSVNR